MKVAFLINELSNLFDDVRDAVVAVRDGEVRYYNGAAARLIPRIGEVKPSEFLPAQALSDPQAVYKGEITIANRRTALAASTINNYRVCVFQLPASGGHTETAELLSAAGVELRNQLSVLKMASGLLFSSIENLGNPRLGKYMSMIYHCYYNLLHLTNNISDLGAFIRGDAPLARTSFDIVASCRDLLGTVAHFAENSGVELRFESNEDSCYIYADRLRLDKLLLNLISNSLKSMTRSGLVTVSVTSAVDRVVLSVSDSGDGIRGDVLPTAWSRYTAPRDLSEYTGGVGLGLSIVQHIARLHGGSAVLESKPGEGTTVTVSLPIEKPDTADLRVLVADNDGAGMEQILTELSGVVSFDKYTPLYMD
jgi:signal transduction histidine kinase